MTTTQTLNAAAIQIGQRIEATYYGQPIAGTVYHKRWHTMNHQAIEIGVRFDEPTDITVCNHTDTRTSLYIYVYSDGSEAVSYTRGNGSTRILNIAD